MEANHRDEDVFSKLKKYIGQEVKEEKKEEERRCHQGEMEILGAPSVSNSSFWYGCLPYSDTSSSSIDSPIHPLIGSTGGTQSHFQRSEASHDGHSSRTPRRGMRSLNGSSIIRISYHKFEAATQCRSRRALPDQHNINLDDGDARDDFMSLPFHGTALNHNSVSVMSNSHPSYATSIQSQTQRPMASLNNTPGHDRVNVIPADGGEFTSGHGTQRNFGAGTQHHPQRALPDQHNIHLLGVNTQYCFMSVPFHGTPLDHDSLFIDMNNSLPNYDARIHYHCRRPPLSLNNPHGHGGSTVITADGGEFMCGHRTIHAEARATRDDETAGLLDLLKILGPVNFGIAIEAARIFLSTYHSTLPFPVKIFGFLTVGVSVAAVFSSFAGLRLGTSGQIALPFGCNPQLMMRMMYNVIIYATAHAFIG